MFVHDTNVVGYFPSFTRIQVGNKVVFYATAMKMNTANNMINGNPENLFETCSNCQKTTQTSVEIERQIDNIVSRESGRKRCEPDYDDMLTRLRR